MKRKHFLILFIFLLPKLVLAQLLKPKIFGAYGITKTAKQVTKNKTLWVDSIKLEQLNVIVFQPFKYEQILILKRFNRFKIIDKSGITCIGLNIDNPTIYGNYKRSTEFVILKYKKSKQHFAKYKDMPKTEVKKLNTEFTFKRINPDTLEINSDFSWTKKSIK